MQLPELSPTINLQTPEVLNQYVDILNRSITTDHWQGSELELQLTKMLLERFNNDAKHFTTDLQYEIDSHSVGLCGYLESSEVH